MLYGQVSRFGAFQNAVDIEGCLAELIVYVRSIRQEAARIDILAALKHIRHKRHEVVMMQVLDPAEIEFPFNEATLFRGLEQWPDLLTDPRSLRQGYLDQFQMFVDELRSGCRSQNIDYVQRVQ